RKHDIQLPLLQLVLDRGEIHKLEHLKLHPETPLDDFHVIGNDTGKFAPAVDKFVWGITCFRANPYDRMRGQPFFSFASNSTVAVLGSGTLLSGVCVFWAGAFCERSSGVSAVTISAADTTRARNLRAGARVIFS